jgi:hypothetical protein
MGISPSDSPRSRTFQKVWKRDDLRSFPRLGGLVLEVYRAFEAPLVAQSR